MSKSRKRALNKKRKRKDSILEISLRSIPPESRESDEDAPSTPLIKKTAGVQVFASTSVNRELRLKDMVNEVKDHVVGPMPLADFVDLFLPNTKHNEIDELKEAAFCREINKMAASKKEEDMYTHFIAAIFCVCPNFPGQDTHRTPFASYQDIVIMPDVSFFSKSSPIDLANIELMAELKLNLGDDAFQENGIIDTQKGTETLGQITAYATAQKSAQFRTHLFSLLVFKTKARILYWDNTGAVTTDLFSLTDKSFMEFFLRYNHATSEQRGHDTSVKVLPKKEFRKLPIGLFPKNANLVSISVDSEEFIAKRPPWMGTGSPFGRSTRCFVAHHVSKPSDLNMVSVKPVLLKDTWRVVGRDREDVIYERLLKNQVPFIPTVMKAGDLVEQKTRVQDIGQSAPWERFKPKILRELQHFRLVLKEVASEITTFQSTKELVSVLHDALQAHRAAYENAGILHRDISAGNILIDDNRRGLLVDWDMSKGRNDEQQVASERTGTWQFTSGRILGHTMEARPVTPNLADDLESFVHVLTWVCLRYTPTNYEPRELGNFLRNIFDNNSAHSDSNQYKGSTNKGSHLRSRAALWGLPASVIKDLLAQLFQVMGVRYERLDMDISASLSPEGRDIMTADYHKRTGFLDNSEWIINTFRAQLKNSDWKINDGAFKNSIEDSPAGEEQSTEPSTRPRLSS